VVRSSVSLRRGDGSSACYATARHAPAFAAYTRPPARSPLPPFSARSEAGRHWPEAVYLHVAIDDHDAAVRTAMDHAPSAFKHEGFLESIGKVRTHAWVRHGT
jgi:hypothetical protein